MVDKTEKSNIQRIEEILQEVYDHSYDPDLRKIAVEIDAMYTGVYNTGGINNTGDCWLVKGGKEDDTKNYTIIH